MPARAGIESAANNGCRHRCLRAQASQVLQIMGAGMDACELEWRRHRQVLQIMGAGTTPRLGFKILNVKGVGWIRGGVDMR